MSAVSILPLAVESAWLIRQKILMDVYNGVNVTDALSVGPAGSAACRGGSKVNWWEVDLDQKYVSASVGCQDGRMIYLITFV